MIIYYFILHFKATVKVRNIIVGQIRRRNNFIEKFICFTIPGTFIILLMPNDYPVIVFDDDSLQDIQELVQNERPEHIVPQIQYIGLKDGCIEIACLNHETKIWFIQMISAWDLTFLTIPFLYHQNVKI